ncbi:MAG: hypothetical protein J7L25_06690 [Deltaproteobacteria bacterium]|nr:hypothetical protein [Candidatus Tharpella aukensis]
MTENKQNNDQNIAITQPEIFKAQLVKAPRQPLSSAYLLFAEALLPLITHYLQRQQIRFKVSTPLNPADEWQKRVIFFSPKLETGNKTVPRFILSYLQNLPHCRLFYRLCSVTGTNPDEVKENTGVLVEYGFQHPLMTPEIVNHLEAETLYLIFADSQRPTLIINPAPILKNDCDLSKPISLIKKTDYSLDPAALSAQASLLQINLRLIDDPYTPETTQALHFTSKELEWLEIILQHLPGPLLAHLRWIGDREHGILLLPEDETPALFPFAEPLKRVKKNLFLPLRQSLRPQLTNPQLDNALALIPEKLTFFTKQLRFDIAEKDFQPLTQMIIAAPTDSAPLRFSDRDEPFEFVWPNRVNLQNSDEAAAKELTKAPAADAANEQAAQLTISKNVESSDHSPTPTNTATTPTKILQEYALRLRRKNDFIGAATCFSLAEEPRLAAECYRLAALALEQQKSTSI